MLIGGEWVASSSGATFEPVAAMDRVAEIVCERRAELASRSEDRAIDIVNRSPYGLLSAVFTRDLRRGLGYAEAVRTGWVNVNEGTNYWESHVPFGGAAGSGSGGAGSEGGSPWNG